MKLLFFPASELRGKRLNLPRAVREEEGEEGREGERERESLRRKKLQKLAVFVRRAAY